MNKNKIRNFLKSKIFFTLPSSLLLTTVSCSYNEVELKSFNKYISTIKKIENENVLINNETNKLLENLSVKEINTNELIHLNFKKYLFIEELLKETDLNNEKQKKLIFNSFKFINNVINEFEEKKDNDTLLNKYNDSILKIISFKNELLKSDIIFSKYLGEILNEFIYEITFKVDIYISKTFMEYIIKIINILDKKINDLLRISEDEKNKFLKIDIYEKESNEYQEAYKNLSKIIFLNNYYIFEEIKNFNNYLKIVKEDNEKFYSNSPQKESREEYIKNNTIKNGLRIKINSLITNELIDNLKENDNENITNEELIKFINETQNKIRKYYKYEILDYKNKYNSFNKLVQFIYKIGPKDKKDTKYVNSVFIGWNSNFEASLNLFNIWKLNINNNYKISNKENFKEDIPLPDRVNGKNIFEIAYNALLKNGGYHE
ncbi:Uncharacterised protein [Mycoplasmopsis maculosa]|uniref:Lipoprotein n=1 Tax=Mycoplasmopsis maculosa TaxID=114885 RepID=A0A449B4E5_9BACT|nr:hypothetical protein [Mycoplasmopsis maculosa]VEU75481.1 Uncharacterised protein [Mycoplasmopsis maculosa]